MISGYQVGQAGYQDIRISGWPGWISGSQAGLAGYQDIRLARLDIRISGWPGWISGYQDIGILLVNGPLSPPG